MNKLSILTNCYRKVFRRKYWYNSLIFIRFILVEILPTLRHDLESSVIFNPDILMFNFLLFSFEVTPYLYAIILKDNYSLSTNKKKPTADVKIFKLKIYME